MQWDYRVLSAWYQKDCKVCKQQQAGKEHWTIDLENGQHYRSIEAGLKAMGQEGWELVVAASQTGGGIGMYFDNNFAFVFKRPLNSK